MSLVEVDLPAPLAWRPAWAALAAMTFAEGWTTDVYASENEWMYHDGGGNWAALRFASEGRALLLGHDHEYSDTYFGEAATYFQEEETDLLAGAPAWWSEHLQPSPIGEWIGFIYAWDGNTWHRAAYDKNDGFASVGLIRLNSVEHLATYASANPVDQAAVAALVAADGSITAEELQAVMPGKDIAAGVAAAHAFLR